MGNAQSAANTPQYVASVVFDNVKFQLDYEHIDSGEGLLLKIRQKIDVGNEVDLLVECSFAGTSLPTRITNKDSKKELWNLFNNSDWKREFLVKRKNIAQPTTVVETKPLVPMASTSTTLPPALTGDNSFDVMISYQWDHQKIVKCIHESLKQEFTVWIDLEQMHGHIVQRMYEAVSRSSVVIACYSSKYKVSYNCTKEISLADFLRKPIAPVHMDKGPFDWLEAIAPGVIYVDLAGIDHAHREWKSKMNTLANEIRKKLKSTTMQPSDTLLDPLAKWLKPVNFAQDVAAYQKAYVEGTRTWLIQKAHQEFLSSRVIWLNGGAGVGKSVMTWLLSQNLPSGFVLGSRFFCRHNDTLKNNTKSVILTTAYQLSMVTALREFKSHLIELMKFYETEVANNRKGLSDLSAADIFTKLIVAGLNKVTSMCEKVVILIDALDECGAQGTPERSDLLNIIQTESSQLPEFVCLFVSGRPEADIYTSLSNLGALELSPSQEENLQDLRLYVKYRLGGLWQRNQSSAEKLSEAGVLLSNKAAGVFIWAKLACDCIDNLPISATEEDILKMIHEFESGLDGMLTNVLRDSYPIDSSTEDYHAVVGAVCVLQQPLSVESLAKLLSIPVSRVNVAVLRNRYILTINSMLLVVVVHKSIPDFLTNPTRCKDRFYIDKEIGNLRLARNCFSTLNSELKFNILNVEEKFFYTPHADIPNFEGLVLSIPDHVHYAGLYATSHLLLVKETRKGILETIDEIVSTKLLYWMELLSVMSRFSDFVGVSAALLAWCSWNNGSSKTLTLRLLSDAKRVCAQFGVPISVCALQVYWSALPFSPVNSTFHQTFASAKWRPKGKYPALLQTQGIATQWSPCLCTCEGHTAFVYAVVISNDSDRIVSGSGDNTVKIWNANTGKEIRTLTGHTGSVYAVAISNDGDRIVSGSLDNTVKIWNANTGKEVLTLAGHTGSVTAVAISNDGDQIVSGSYDNTVKIWTANTGKEIRTLTGHTREVNAVAISNDGDRIVSGSEDSTVKIWDANTGKEIRTLTGHTREVNAVAISNDGDQIVSGSWDNTVKIWNANTGKEIRTLTGHSGEVTSVAIINDGHYILSKSPRESFVWSMETGEQRNAMIFIGSSSKESSCFTIDSGWVKENEELRFWIPFELRGITVISDTRIVSFPPPVDGYVTAAFIDVSFG
ncbi:hypothetical protein HK098_005900 [Nowakowskiella sp. JEL0407]|nr:hypothetical protein HK098_005900 [Nowakowskiella sp. JEL0407]